MELCVQDGSSQIIYSRNETKTRNFESELRISKVFHVLTVGVSYCLSFHHSFD
ncbi:unnamed protein product [Brassica oleracea]|uniref:(rape) hypothetical protein n=1 Tax=Brassica napus TaxID=3708 RepID=A0A816LSD2_BRANA|nr:unnamed protein product [Brassica napus]